jgi:hypothetical protein
MHTFAVDPLWRMYAVVVAVVEVLAVVLLA